MDALEPLLPRNNERRGIIRQVQHSEDASILLGSARVQMQRFLLSKPGHYAVLILVSLDVSCIFADFVIQIFRCEQKGPTAVWDRSIEALGIISLVFSCLFMLELMASVWAFGARFFKSKFHCFDATVILAGFVIDVLLKGVLEEIASVVIVLRLWRVFKIIEELTAGAKEQTEAMEETVDSLEKQIQSLKEELRTAKMR